MAKNLDIDDEALEGVRAIVPASNWVAVTRCKDSRVTSVRRVAVWALTRNLDGFDCVVGLVDADTQFGLGYPPLVATVTFVHVNDLKADERRVWKRRGRTR